MRRFLTLICMLGLTIPAGLSITGCTRNPAAKYCPVTSGYGEPVTAITSIIEQPEIGGISLAYGQTEQADQPTAYTCQGSTAIVNANAFTYGTTNNQLVDISPTGDICAGTWNRNTGGGIPDYTICNPPNPAPSTGGLPYSVGYISASAHSVTSNPVAVYVHAPITSVKLVGPSSCLSQGNVANLDAQACYGGANNKQYLLCAPSSVTQASSPDLACPLAPGVQLNQIKDCVNVLGTLSFSVSNQIVAQINSTNNQITAEYPGTTNVTASIAGSGSSAGYFSTCPPASIKVALANGSTSGTVTQGVPQNLTTTVKDTNGNTITGLTLDYQSTNPIDLTVNNKGVVTTNFPGAGSVTAICQPPECDPAPINVVGLNGTGTSIASNPVVMNTPGTASDFVWFAAPNESEYFVPYELLTHSLGSTVRLPYVPNSMVMDEGGTDLYFGSQHELMVYDTLTDLITKQDVNTPGVVLAVAPNNSLVLINDQIRQLFYIYNTTSGSYFTFPGVGVAAQWTPDSKTLYIVDSTSANNAAEGITGHTNTLYVYNDFTGWTTHNLSSSNGALAITVPSVGAYLSGAFTVAHTWCPSGTVGNNATVTYYPQGDELPDTPTDILAATSGGHHILGAYLGSNGTTLDDIGVTIPTTGCSVTTTGTGASQVQTMNPLTISSAARSEAIPGIFPTSLNQIVTSPISDLSFLTYNGSTPGALLPFYLPNSSGTMPPPGFVQLSGGTAVTAPVAGAFSPDDTKFFVSTAGDNKIHILSIPKNVSITNPPTDSLQISPNLPACTPPSAGGVDAYCTYTGTSPTVPATVIAVAPRSTT